jgi:ABC-2 type transport system permease protein
MNELVRAALVIARRDYVASVWSKAFLLFLLGPLLPIIAGAFFGTVGANVDKQAARVTVALVATPAEGAALAAARQRLAARLGEDTLPELRLVPPAARTDALLAETGQGTVIVARGGIAAPLLIGPRDALAGARGGLALLYDEARQAAAIGQSGAALPPPVEIATRIVDRAPSSDASARMTTARVGQFVLMLLTMILAGMLLSNLIEEKSSKVIEVLAAAVPVDAIFLGKLLAMLGMSLTGIAIWGGVATTAILAFVPASAAIPAPAVGWPAFLALGVAYFVTCYLLLGSLFLGIGAQASTVREVQTLSMPVTMAQLGVVAFASSVVGQPDSSLAFGAMLFPWSSPFAMIARAAQAPELWPHLLAIVWQGLWVALIIRFASARFRASVLKSGRPGRSFRRKNRRVV